ncbi:DMT family transporter [Paraburkholderia sp. 31.1]|uniref:DMT family transporter n=1 Tax=Paraburkholderia sp. 31.1 TaxID=2615205 RepID=UPI001655D486|nr:DMT family transporter [Paraburkholderia sp. 31.1]MBC8724645.1 DMT family transporter [Paraburkholderia sp. 31.1]
MKPIDLARLVLLSAIWGSSFLLMRIVVPGTGIVTTTFLREGLGASGLALVLLFARLPWRFDGKLHLAMLLGVLNSAVPFLLYSVAAEVLPSGYSAIINATTPMMGVVIGAMFFAERVTPAKSLGVVVGLCGVGVLTQRGPVTFGWQELQGVVACLLAVACYGFSGFLTQRWIAGRGGLDNRLLAFGSQFGAVVVLVPLFGYQAFLHAAHLPSEPGTWLAIAALGFGCSTLAYLLYFRLIADIGPLRSMSVTFLVPLFGVVFGAIFLHERLTLAHLTGGLLIAVALYLVLVPSRSSAVRVRASLPSR